MPTFLDQLFTSQEDALRKDLRGFTDQAVADATRVTNSAANRGAASPAALAASSAAAGRQQRAAMAGQQAGMLSQARQADQARAGQFVGSLLNTAGSIGGMALGGPAGGAVGGAAGGALGSLLGAPGGASQPAQAPAQAFTMAQPSGGLGRALGSPGGTPIQAPAAPQVAAATQPLGSIPAPNYAPVQPAGQMAERPGSPIPSPSMQPAPAPQQAQPAQPTGQFDFGLTPLQPVQLPQLSGQNTVMGQFVRSDEDSKREIENAALAIDQFLQSMSPQSYQYNNPQAPGARPGRTTGVMAQDVAGSQVGQQITRTDPQTGQMGYDANGALQALMAASARLHDRLSALESGTPATAPVDAVAGRSTPPEDSPPAPLPRDQQLRTDVMPLPGGGRLTPEGTRGQATGATLQLRPRERVVRQEPGLTQTTRAPAFNPALAGPLPTALDRLLSIVRD